MKNAEIAAIFDDIAERLKAKKDNIFKIRAYQKVARAIESLPVSVEQMVEENRLDEIPGAGEAIAKKLTELVTTGKLEYYEKLKAEFPEEISALLDVPGIGPKTAMLLSSKLGVKSADDIPNTRPLKELIAYLKRQDG